MYFVVAVLRCAGNAGVRFLLFTGLLAPFSPKFKVQNPFSVFLNFLCFPPVFSSSTLVFHITVTLDVLCDVMCCFQVGNLKLEMKHAVHKATKNMPC